MVEWKNLISISDILYGYPFDSSMFSEDSNNTPLIRIRDIKPAKASTYYTGDFLEEYKIKRGDILVGMDGEFNLGRWDDRDGLLNQRVLKLSGKDGLCLDGYLFHYMGPVFKKIELKTAGGSVKHLSAKVINQIQIPIPSLSEQSRIVSILDTFTASIENLKEQIAERRKQYEYQRDQLLDLEGKEGVEMKKLGEIIQVKKGEYITKKEAKEGIYPVILGGKEPAYYIDKYNHTGKAMVMSRSGASAGYVSLWNEPIFVTDGFLIEPRGDVVFEYLYYTLKSKQGELHGSQKGGAIPHVTPASIGVIQVRLPNISVQSRIVSILDTFEASIANLEAQLELRQKQYEYYRNQLLTFE